ncbi:MAG: hypothetical protein U1E59_12055 [Amaricoccus sp.]
MSWWERLDDVEGEHGGYVDLLWWGITVAIAGVVGGVLLMLVG